MNQTLYMMSLGLVALVVLVNRGNRNRVHQAIQLYLTVPVLFGSPVAFGRL